MKPATPIQSIIQENVRLAPFTTWKVGGRARFFAEPSEEEVPALLQWAEKQGLPWRVLGRGSNVLIPDAGLPGLTIITRNSLCRLERIGDSLLVGAGVSLPKLSRHAAALGFAGFEFLIGIPGTVGGGMAMNAGLTVFRPREMADVASHCRIVDKEGHVHEKPVAELRPAYRHTTLLESRDCLVSVIFPLRETDAPEKIRQRTLEHLAERKRKQPLDKPTAGSTFKSPPGSKGAGWYIEQAGLKGYQIGGARVSTKHANWIENTGGASADDIRKLIELVQLEVKARMDISLEVEVTIL